MRKIMTLWLVCATVGLAPEEPPVPVLTATDRGDAITTADPSADVVGGAATTATQVSGDDAQDPFSLYLADAEIRDVLHLLGRHFELNIITTPEVQGRISVYFTGVDPQAALGAIVNANGFAYRRTGNIIEVFREAPEEVDPAAAPSALALRMVELIHVDATELAQTIRGLVPEDSDNFEDLTVQVEPRRNALVIKGPTDVVDRVVELVTELDHPIPQIRIEVQILETVISDSQRYGIDWFARIAASGAKRPHTFPFNNGSTKAAFWPKNQVQGDDLTFSSSTGTTESSSLPLFPDNSAFPFTNVNDFIFGSLDASQLAAVMELIDAETDTRLVSRPEITTMNNHEAIITIGNEVPIPTYTRNEETNVTHISGFDTQYIGTTLSVLPRVSAENQVLMKIKPEISDILEFRGEGAFQLPVTATRAAETTVTLEDGKTLVIGGLVREREIQKVSKFPFLGDIPGLKYLFSYEGKDVEKSDLLIFITPHILGEDRMQNTGKIEFEGEWLTEPQLAEISAVRGRLGNPSIEARLEGVWALGRVVDETVLRLLDPTRLLKRHASLDPSREVRVAASLALAVEDADVLLEAFRDVARTKDPEAVRALIDYAVTEPAIHLRLAAVETAATIDRFATIDLLNRAGAEGSVETAERAAVGLWALGNGSDDAIVLFDVDADDAYLQAAVLRALSTQGGKAAALHRWRQYPERSYPAQLMSWVAARPASESRVGASIHSMLERRAAEASTLELRGSLYERKKLEEAMNVLGERAGGFAHLVRSFLDQIEVHGGPTTLDVDTASLRLSRLDLEDWHVFSLAHQLVRYGAAVMLADLGRDLHDIDQVMLACRTQYWAVHTLLGMTEEHRRDYTGFLDSVLARQRAQPTLSPTARR